MQVTVTKALAGGLLALVLAGCSPRIPDDAASVSGAVTEATPVRPTEGGSTRPLNADPSNPSPDLVSISGGLSGENDFEAVSGQRDITADAELLQRNRERYVVIAPQGVPERDAGGQPNIVAYALRTNNPVGVRLYRRNPFRSENRSLVACAAYASADLAQVAFLKVGGPDKDPLVLDPDGDGFACRWTPETFRALAGQ